MDENLDKMLDQDTNRLTVYIHYNEYDEGYKRPTLVIQNGFGDSVGYEIDPDTMDVGE